MIVLSGVLSLSAIQGLKRSAARRAAIELMKAKFEQQAFFRQITKRLYNFHACGATVGSGGSITAIKNHAGVDSFRVGQKYGRGYVNFDGASVSISGNTADFVVTASRYDKKKQQTSGSIKKTWELTLVRGPSSIEGCYIDDAVDTVTEIHEKQSCESIEAMVWSGGKCVLNPFVGKECNNPGKALNQVGLDGVFGCCDVKWVPDHREWCTGEAVPQSTGCNGSRTETGTKSPSWPPSTGSVCCGQSFTQTESCKRGNPGSYATRSATGSKCCGSCGDPCCAPCPPCAPCGAGEEQKGVPGNCRCEAKPCAPCAADEEQIGSPGNCKCEKKGVVPIGCTNDCGNGTVGQGSLCLCPQSAPKDKKCDKNKKSGDVCYKFVGPYQKTGFYNDKCECVLACSGANCKKCGEQQTQKPGDTCLAGGWGDHYYGKFNDKCECIRPCTPGEECQVDGIFGKRTNNCKCSRKCSILDQPCKTKNGTSGKTNNRCECVADCTVGASCSNALHSGGEDGIYNSNCVCVQDCDKDEDDCSDGYSLDSESCICRKDKKDGCNKKSSDCTGATPEFNAGECKCECTKSASDCDSTTEEFDSGSCSCKKKSCQKKASDCTGATPEFNAGECKCECTKSASDCDSTTEEFDSGSCSCKKKSCQKKASDCTGATPEFNASKCKCECTKSSSNCAGSTPTFDGNKCDCVCTVSASDCDSSERFDSGQCKCVKKQCRKCATNQINDPNDCTKCICDTSSCDGGTTRKSYPNCGCPKCRSCATNQKNDPNDCTKCICDTNACSGDQIQKSYPNCGCKSKPKPKCEKTTTDCPHGINNPSSPSCSCKPAPKPACVAGESCDDAGAPGHWESTQENSNLCLCIPEPG